MNVSIKAPATHQLVHLRISNGRQSPSRGGARFQEVSPDAVKRGNSPPKRMKGAFMRDKTIDAPLRLPDRTLHSARRREFQLRENVCPCQKAFARWNQGPAHQDTH